MFGIEISLLQAITWIGIAASLWFYFMSVVGVRDFFRARRSEDEPMEDWAPPVTILKPLKGAQPSLYANLLTFCDQQYPAFQIVFGVASPQDPAVAIVERLRRERPQLDIELVVDGRIYGSNYKVSNLINMMGRARHALLALSDGDIRVPRDYLRRVVAPLRDPKIGLVSCLYRARMSSGSSNIESLFVNTDFCHQILVARKVEKPTYAFGASVVMRRETLDAVGGFQSLANFLADDYFLGHLVAERGLQLWLSDCVVETILEPAPLSHVYHHQMRWARTFRSVRPWSYFATVVTQGTMWAVASVIVGGFSAAALGLAAIVAATRVATSAVISWRYLATNLGPLELLQILVKDLFMSAIWLGAFLGDEVWWSGRRFRVHRTGEMELLRAPEPVDEGAPIEAS